VVRERRLKAFAVNIATGAVDRQPQPAPPNAILSSYKAMPGEPFRYRQTGARRGLESFGHPVQDPWCAGGRAECSAEDRRTRGRLIAFDAETLRTLWQSEANTLAKFSAPTIANGRVYLSTFDHKIVVYGLNGQPRPTYPPIRSGSLLFDDSKCVGTANNGSMANGTELVIWTATVTTISGGASRRTESSGIPFQGNASARRTTGAWIMGRISSCGIAAVIPIRLGRPAASLSGAKRHRPEFIRHEQVHRARQQWEHG